MDAEWDTHEYLLAIAVDALTGANWQRGGGEGSQPPPVPRPADQRERISKEDRASAKADAFLRRQAQRQLRDA